MDKADAFDVEVIIQQKKWKKNGKNAIRNSWKKPLG
nr:MAG TPA: hypothetical protein [Caudoviricetes sp.]